ncbi:hypothetical protein LINPERPRIM_LOCUS2312 [Linum perenne]
MDHSTVVHDRPGNRTQRRHRMATADGGASWRFTYPDLTTTPTCGTVIRNLSNYSAPLRTLRAHPLHRPSLPGSSYLYSGLVL